MATLEQVRDVKQRHAPRLLAEPGVSGVGVEKDDAGNYVLAIHLDTADPAVRDRIPAQIEGSPVKVVVEGGPFRKQGR
jgi:hypothetical protein